jgi:hypothetical protein
MGNALADGPRGPRRDDGKPRKAALPPANNKVLPAMATASDVAANARWLRDAANRRARWAVCVADVETPFQNGVIQNAIFLVDALRALWPEGTVHLLDVACGPDVPAVRPLARGALGPDVQLHSAARALGAALPAEVTSKQGDAMWAAAAEWFSTRGGLPYDVFVAVSRVTGRHKQMGAYVVLLDCAHAASTHLAEWSATAPHRDLSSTPCSTSAFLDGVHEVWDLPSQAPRKALGKYVATLTPPTVVRGATVPHLWSPRLTDRTLALAGLPLLPRFDTARLAGAPPLHLLIATENMGFAKNACWAAVACERLHQAAPHRVERVVVARAPQGRGPSAVAASLQTLTREGKLEMRTGTCPMPDLLRDALAHPTVVLTDHLYCPLNYSYYTFLHAGLPLVHCSNELRDAGVGYWYERWNVLSCIAAILAAGKHDAAAQARAAAYVEHACSPSSLTVQEWLRVAAEGTLARAKAHVRSLARGELAERLAKRDDGAAVHT